MPGRYICAGIPRCGTTLMFRALAGLPPGSKTPVDYNGPIEKTHTFRPRRLEGVEKAIFMFGDPVAAVVSTRLRRYSASHFRHCGAKARDPDTTDIFREDALNYGRMFKAWTRAQGFDTICVRYETLYQNLPLVRDFFGFELFVPPFKPRKTCLEDAVSAEDLAAIQATYDGLITAVERSPDVMVFRARPS